MFVALFDYDPLSMSPNPDAADEELPFKEGQIIKVRGACELMLLERRGQNTGNDTVVISLFTVL